MAWLHAGAWGDTKFRCSSCHSNPNLKKAWGCEEKTLMPRPTFIEDDSDNKRNAIENRYWNCPIRFIPTSILDFWGRYVYYQDFPGAKMPAYDDLNPKFLEAITTYRRAYDSMRKEVQKRSQ